VAFLGDAIEVVERYKGEEKASRDSNAMDSRAGKAGCEEANYDLGEPASLEAFAEN
jgi:hypothetical protein